MTREEATHFLQAHQPMPLRPPDLLVEQYLRAVEVLEADHSEESLLLRLRSLSFGLGAYESVLDSVLSCGDHAAVIRAIGKALETSNDTNLYWASLAALEVPDESYLIGLRNALGSKDVGVRGAAVTALERLGDAGRSALISHAPNELDADVRAQIETALGK